MAQTIRDFLVSINWDIGESDQRRFVGALEGATLRAKLLGDVLEDFGRKALDAITSVASAFDRLYFSAQRTGASASMIQDFGYAVKQLGGSAEAAQASLEAMGQKLRENPGNIAFINQLGFGLNKVTGQLEIQRDLLAKFQSTPLPQAEIVRGMVGEDERTFLAMRDPQLLKGMDESSAYRKRLGFDPNQASKDANAFMGTWRRTSMQLGNIADDVFTKLMRALDGPLTHLSKFLDEHAPEIGQAVDKIATAIGILAVKFDAWFEGIDWSKVGENLKTFANGFAKITDAVGGLTNAFEILFALWASGKFVGALAAMSRMLAVLGPLGDLAILLGLGAAVHAIGNDQLNNGPGAGQGTQGVFSNGSAPSDDTIENTPGLGVDPSKTGPLTKGWNWLRGKFGYGDQSSGADASPGATGSDRHLAGGTPSGLSGRTQAAMAVAMDQLRKEGVPESNLRAAAALLTGNAIAESGVDPNALHDKVNGVYTGYGIYGAHLERRDRMLAWLGKNGYAKDSLEGQMRYMAHEAMGMPAVNGILKGATPDSLGSLDYGFIKGFENPAVVGSRRAQVSLAYNTGPGSLTGGGGGNAPTTVTGETDKGRFINGQWFPWWAHPTAAYLAGTAGAGAQAADSSGWDKVQRDAAQGNANISRWETQGPWGSLDAHAFDRPLGGSGGDVNHVSANQNVTIHVDGANDPSIVAHMVASNIKSTNSDLTRNLIGATN